MAAHADVTWEGNSCWANKEERGQQWAGNPPRISSGPRRVWGLKWRLEAHVLYHKILGTLHLHRRPENTRHDSVYMKLMGNQETEVVDTLRSPLWLQGVQKCWWGED